MKQSKSHHRHNQEIAAHLRTVDPMEQRAKEIAQSEGREEISAEDRARAEAELQPPNQLPNAPEVESTWRGVEPGSWTQPEGSSGQKIEPTEQEDEESDAQHLFEEGLKAPRKSRYS